MASGKRFIATFAVLGAIFGMLGVNATGAEGRYGAASDSIKQDLDRLVAAYPTTVAGHDNTFITLKNGTRFPISDGRTDKTFKELLESPDIDDMFLPLFAAMYGDCRKNEVVKNLRTVKWLPKHGGGSVKVTTVNGVADALERVSRELDDLPDDVVTYLVPVAGTYNCRTVAGTRRPSMHAYGAAIDIDTRYADYWRWSPGETPRWRNRIPVAIVRIFEQHGFIWGGAWYHYDTMHFEYRPELLPRRASE